MDVSAPIIMLQPPAAVAIITEATVTFVCVDQESLCRVEVKVDGWMDQQNVGFFSRRQRFLIRTDSLEIYSPNRKFTHIWHLAGVNFWPWSSPMQLCHHGPLQSGTDSTEATLQEEAAKELTLCKYTVMQFSYSRMRANQIISLRAETEAMSVYSPTRRKYKQNSGNVLLQKLHVPKGPLSWLGTSTVLTTTDNGHWMVE